MLKTVPDHPNYAVSDQGKIYRITKDGYKEIKSNTCGRKYPTVKLDRKNYYVQRLVATAFVPRYYEDQTVITHADNDIFNNAASNLVWVSPREAQQISEWTQGFRINNLKELAKQRKIDSFIR